MNSMEVSTQPLAVQLDRADNKQQYDMIREVVNDQGYRYFYDFLETIKQRIKAFTELDEHGLRQLLDKAMHVIPNPEKISPAWERIWEKLQLMIDTKANVLEQIDVQQRDGEWEVILDNPFSQDRIACYPNLTFDEAAYLFSYFRAEVTKNEYVKLQKIVTAMIHYGKDGES